MTKRWIKVFLSMIVGVTIVVILTNYLERWAILVLLLAVILGQVAYYYLFKSKGEAKLQFQLDAPKYDEFIESKYKDKKENLYNLTKAYVKIHQGKHDEAEGFFNKYENNYLLKNKSIFYIYIKTKAELAFYKEDREALRGIQAEFKENPLYVDYVEQFIQVFELILDGKYVDARELMFEIIPRQKTRLDIIELEYYLAKIYVLLEIPHDAKAVAEFVVEKNYNVVYTELCKEILAQIKEK